MESIQLLLVADLDSHSVSKIAEHFVPLPPIFDAVIACGPFVRHVIESPEEMADRKAHV